MVYLNFAIVEKINSMSTHTLHTWTNISVVFTPQRQESDNPKIGPHLNFTHPDKGILDDVAALVIHHAKRQTGNLNRMKGDLHIGHK